MKRNRITRRNVLIATAAAAGATAVPLLLRARDNAAGSAALEGIPPETGELYRQQDYQEAVRVLTAKLETIPDSADTYILRGMAFHRAGNYSAAVADFSKALGLSPSDLRVYLYRGESYLATGRKDLAVADFEAIMRAAPGDKRLTAAAQAKLSALAR
ncbi:MAG: tetratricopeptide repeat protein [Chloroflexi bacterium]|nr:tetratricopeptide repeat protein [Chloroflexota bacterium]